MPFVKLILEHLLGKTMEKMLTRNNSMTTLIFLLVVYVAFTQYRMQVRQEDMQINITNLQDALYYKFNISVPHHGNSRDNGSEGSNSRVPRPVAVITRNESDEAKRSE